MHATQGKPPGKKEPEVVAMARVPEITIRAKEITPEEARMISTDYVRKRLSIRN